MRFLLDNNLSPRLAASLTSLGHEASHVSSFGLGQARDDAVLAKAIEQDAVLITADTDFPEIVALSRAAAPSILYLKGRYPVDPYALAVLIHNQLEHLAEALAAGAVVAIDGARLRIRSLPIDDS